jgi:hypothetical protein
MNDQATIEVHRPPTIIGGRQHYAIFLDGRPIGTIENGTSRSLLVPAGDHTMFIKSPNAYDVFRTQTIRFSVESGRTKAFEFGHNRLYYMSSFIVLGAVIADFFTMVACPFMFVNERLRPNELGGMAQWLMCTGMMVLAVMWVAGCLLPGLAQFLKELN